MTAIFSALLCVLAPLSVPLGGLVPISLATFVIYLASALLDVRSSVLSVIVYILLGAVGLPVFSGWQGGVGKLLGVTGGYIIGYIPMAFVISIARSRFSRKWALPVSMICGTLVLYVIGTAWFVFQTENPILSALSSCVLPFIPGDAVKIALACGFSFALKRPLSRFLR